MAQTPDAHEANVESLHSTQTTGINAALEAMDNAGHYGGSGDTMLAGIT